MEKKVQEFKEAVIAKRNNPNIDHKRPYKKSKRLEIKVSEREGGKADVALLYDMRYSRMWGQHDTVYKIIIDDVDLPTACNAARSLKLLLPSFKIVFYKFNPEDLELF